MYSLALALQAKRRISAMNRKYIVTLTAEERQQLKVLTGVGKNSAPKVKRAWIRLISSFVPLSVPTRSTTKDGTTPPPRSLASQEGYENEMVDFDEHDGPGFYVRSFRLGVGFNHPTLRMISSLRWVSISYSLKKRQNRVSINEGIAYLLLRPSQFVKTHLPWS
jgi:hypothetical protein